MDEFVGRPTKRPITNNSRVNLGRSAMRSSASISSPNAPKIHQQESPNMNDTPSKPKKKFNLGGLKPKNFKLPTPKNKKQWIIFGVIASLIIGCTGFAVYWFVFRDSTAPVTYIEPEPEPEPEPTTGQSPVSGREVALSKIDQPIYSVQIENSPEARPQSGLIDADIVTEAIAEGGITRFNAIYHDRVPANLGPVRSMRSYFIDWFLPYNAGAVHVGGSPQALQEIRTLGVQDMDIYCSNTCTYSRRISSRYSPHNLYTTGKQMRNMFKDKGYKNGDFTSLPRKPLERDQETDETEESAEPTEKDNATEKPATTPKAAKVDLNISRALYNVSFTWDKKSNSYPRTMAGAPHVDADNGKRIAPDVVVIPVLNKSIHPDGVHTVYKTVGTGTLFVFQDGEVIKGTWKKPSREAQWQLLDAKGESIELNPGQTWFTIIESANRVSY